MLEYDFPVDARLNQDGQFSVLVVDGESAHLLNPGTLQTKELGYRDQETAMIIALNQTQPDKVRRGSGSVASGWSLVDPQTSQSRPMTRESLAYELASIPSIQDLLIEVTGYDYSGTFSEYDGAEEYEWNIDGGAWESLGLDTFFSGTGSLGAHTVRVRAVLETGYSGVAVSDEFLTGLAPTNTVAPYIDNITPNEGDVMMLNVGGWDNNPSSFTAKWYADGEEIEGETETSLTAPDYPHETVFTADVFASNIIGTSSGEPTNNSATLNNPDHPRAPVFSEDPIITSDANLSAPQVGDMLSATTGIASGSPTFSYQWKQGSDNANAAGSGSTDSDYFVDATDDADTLYCRVGATNAGGTTYANSNASGTVSVDPSELIFQPAEDLMFDPAGDLLFQ